MSRDATQRSGLNVERIWDTPTSSSWPDCNASAPETLRMGGNIAAVLCTELNRNVVWTQHNGELDLTIPGAYERKDSITGAPAECPLLDEPGTRKLAQFAICNDCPHGSFSLTKVEIKTT